MYVGGCVVCCRGVCVVCLRRRKKKATSACCRVVRHVDASGVLAVNLRRFCDGSGVASRSIVDNERCLIGDRGRVGGKSAGDALRVRSRGIHEPKIAFGATPCELTPSSSLSVVLADKNEVVLTLVTLSLE